MSIPSVAAGLIGAFLRDLSANAGDHRQQAAAT
jgi:hypothetical protein